MSVEDYFEVVRSCLERVGTWRETWRKFGIGVRRAVEEILRRFEYHHIDPATLDWCSEFQKLRDYDTVADFLSALEYEGKIPPPVEPELEAALSRLEEEARELGMEIAEAGTTERLKELEREREKMRREIRRLRELVSMLKPERLAKFTERISKLEAELKRKEAELKAKEREIKEYKTRLERAERRLAELEAKLPTTRPEAVPSEISKLKGDFWTFFQAELMRKGVSPTTAKRYRPLFEDEFKRILRDIEGGVPRGYTAAEYVERELGKVVDRLLAVRPPRPPTPVPEYKPLIRFGVVPTKERERYFAEYLDEIGISWEQYLALDPFTRAELEGDFMRWLERRLYRR